ncbi:MAG: TonB-dependent receptor [Bacteroidia bacterium]|nr:TonB-dependent receptor [Bacteroidia bacterium]
MQRIFPFATVVVLTLWYVAGYAQQPSAAALGRLRGIVQDSATGTPIEYATIALYRVRDSSLAGGGVTDAQGAFDLKDLTPGMYEVRVDFLGYRQRQVGPVRLAPPPRGEGLEQSLGSISLAAAALQLESVEISAERSFITQSLDKKSYDVQQMVNTQGGTALDVLGNIPSISVDVDNNISLRGNQQVTVLIDGKPSSMSGANLANLQAAGIAYVEVITNPSAKYDPDGTSGIINIVMKKNRNQGTGGMVNLSAGTRHKYNTGIQGYTQIGKLNLFGNYSFRYDNRFFRGDNERTFDGTGGETTFIQSSNEDIIGRTHLVQANAEYALDDASSLSFRGMYNYTNRSSAELITYETLNAAGARADLYYRDVTELRPGYNADLNLGYRRFFKQNPRHSLVFDVTHSFSENDPFEFYVNRYYTTEGTPAGTPDDRQQVINPVIERNTTFQLDYTWPLSDNRIVEAGAKTILRYNDNDFYSELLNTSTSQYEVDFNTTNRFVYQDQIHAVYGTWADKWKKWSYKAGVRVEQTWINFELKTTGETFDNALLNVFPSAYLAYDIGDRKQFLLNYSRRINRPNARSLNPFTDYSDPLNLRFGNPYLRPEFINSYEAGYVHYWGAASVNATLYYRDIQQAFTRFVTVDSLGVSRVTQQNLGSARNYGVDMVYNTTIGKVWSLMASANVFRSDLDATNLGVTSIQGAWVGNFRLNNTLRLPQDIDVQVTGYYNTPQNTPQGRMIPRTAVDVSVRKKIAKGKGNLALAVTDVFDTQQFGMSASDLTFSQSFIRKRESRIGTLSFTWRFGKADTRRRDRQEVREPRGDDF